MTANELANKLGRSAIADAVGVGASAVSEALRLGGFPASWYAAVTDLGDANGVEVPMDVFRFKSAITRTDTTPPLSPRENDVKEQ